MVIECCVCGKHRVEGQWIAGGTTDDMVSHTYCPRCKETSLAEMRREMMIERLAARNATALAVAC